MIVNGIFYSFNSLASMCNLLFILQALNNSNRAYFPAFKLK